MKKTVYIYNIIILSAFVFSTYVAQAQFGIIPAREPRDQLTGHGITYSLPMHEITFSIEVVRSSYVPGRFQEYSFDLLGLETEKEAFTKYQIRAISLSSEVLPDSRYRYILPRPTEARKGGEDVALFNGDGILQYYGRSSYAGRSASACQHGVPGSPDWVMLKTAPGRVPLNLDKDDPDTFQIGLSRDTLPERQYPDRATRTPTERERAEDVAKRLAEHREARYRLFSGYQEVEYSREALAYMVEGLAQMEDEYMAFFTGYTTEERRTYRFSIIPDDRNASSWVPFFRFSTSDGVNNLGSGDGDLVFVRWEGTDLAEEKADTTTLSVDQPASSGPLIWHRLPALTTFQLRLGSEEIFRGEEYVSQLGRLESTGINRISIEYDPATGEPLKVIFDN